MKEIKSSKKTNVLKKLFIKICRLSGFELIDQSNLEFPVSQIRDKSQFSEPGKKSVSLGSGKTVITRKVEGIDIIFKTCTSVQLVSQNKKRIFEKQKNEYTFRSAKSLHRSALDLREKFPKIDINFTIIDIGSPKSDISKLVSFFKGFNCELIELDSSNLKFEPKTINKNNEKIESNMATTMAAINESLARSKKSKDLVYFVEDDYIHRLDSLSEMIFTYEKFSSIFKKELFLLSTDYPYLYKKFDSTNILFGEKCHWRTVKESLLTFLTSKKMILKYFEKLDEMSKIENNPFEKNLHEIYEEELCFSPMPSLSIHCTNVNSIFGLSPNIDIKKLWKENEDL